MGGLFGGGSSKNQTVTQTQLPPPWVQPYAEQMLGRGVQLSQAPYQGYAGDRLAPFAPQQTLGIDMLTQRAMQGSPLNWGGQNFLANQMAGMNAPVVGTNPYAGQNPYFEQALQNTLGDVQGRVNAQFAGNAFGGSAHQEQLAKALGSTALGARMQEYGRQGELAEADIARRLEAQKSDITARLQAAGLSPTLMGQDYQDIQHLLGAGDVLRQAEQERLNLGYEDWIRQQQFPYQQLDVLGNTIRQSMGGSGSVVQTGPAPFQPNRFASSLGGGLAGYGVGSMFGDEYAPYGAAAGAILPWIFPSG